MKEFLMPLYKELRELEMGLNVKLCDETKTFYFFLILGVCDKPARNEITNMKSANGYFGCLKCLIKGESVPFSNGRHVIYRYEAQINLRNRINYEFDLYNKSNGVLGPCFLNNFTYFQVVESMTIDFMHSICLGVIKNMFNYWFTDQNKKYSMKSKLELLNERFYFYSLIINIYIYVLIYSTFNYTDYSAVVHQIIYSMRRGH